MKGRHLLLVELATARLVPQSGGASFSLKLLRDLLLDLIWRLLGGRRADQVVDGTSSNDWRKRLLLLWRHRVVPSRGSILPLLVGHVLHHLVSRYLALGDGHSRFGRDLFDVIETQVTIWKVHKSGHVLSRHLNCVGVICEHQATV